MNLSVKLKDILFLDIETVPQEESWDNLTELTKELFKKKTQYQRKDEISAEDFYNRAGIWAEFGKIVCISVGYFVEIDNKMQLRLTSFFGDNEKQILIDFKELLDKHFVKKSNILCAHNGKELS